MNLMRVLARVGVQYVVSCVTVAVRATTPGSKRRERPLLLSSIMSDDEHMHSAAGSDGEESTVSSPTAVPSKKGSATKKKTAAAASDKKKAAAAAPAKKRKEADGEEKAAKRVKGASASAAAASSDDPKEIVRAYMVQQNRPYTALVVYENLHQRIKKPALIRIMDELTEEGHLQSKDFKKVRVYLVKQGAEAAADPAELEQLAAKDTETRQQLAEIKASNRRLEEQVKMLLNEPNEEELATQLKQYQKQVDSLNARLARIKGDGKQVDKASMQRVQKAFNDACTMWVKRKKAAMEMMGDMAGEDGALKDVIERLGIETDEDAEVKLADWKALIK